MDNFLQFLRQTDAVPMLAVTGAIAVCILPHYWYKMRVKQWEMSLKHAMLEQGMTADEITKVLEASARETSSQQHRCRSKMEHVS